MTTNADMLPRFTPGQMLGAEIQDARTPAWYGVADGLESPFGLSMRLSLPDVDHQELYDLGVNVGQAIMRLLMQLPAAA